MTLEAVRMRAYRRRLGRGQKVAPLPFDDDIVGYLIDARLLPPEGEASRLEIGQAAFKALVRIAKSQA